jgi:hypothetical protein
MKTAARKEAAIVRIGVSMQGLKRSFTSAIFELV